MCGGGGRSNSAANYAAEQQAQLAAQQRADAEAAAAKARQEAADRQNRLQTGMANIDAGFKGYDDNYYNTLAKSYEESYLPQLQDQYRKSQDKLLFNLARAGTLESSNRGEGLAEIERTFGQNKQDILSKGQNYAQGARSQIENQRGQLINQLNATGGDPVTSQNFLNGAISVNAPTLPSFSPLGDLFGNIGAIAANDARVSNAQGNPGILQSAFNSFGKKKQTTGASSYQQ